MHLSRLAEEIVIWASAGFAFVALSDEFTTGSSMMPQKRNPDAAELTRAKAGRIFAALMGLLTVMKGLPLAYSKDMQEDKEPTFDALDNLSLMLAAMTGMVADLEPQEKAMRKAAGASFSTATDLADWLVRTLDMPFRHAHEATGKIVALAEKKGVPLARLPLKDMQGVVKDITEDVFSVLTPAKSVRSRKSYGGTAPSNVRKMARRWIKRLESEATSG
jgi:argininosuccinate lyase